jgi:Holliday junction resolvase RusA-like endonuclease
MTHTYIVEGILPGYNEAMNEARCNRYGSATTKRSYTAFCANEAKRQHIPVITKPIIVSVLWIEKDRRRDPDNIASALKYLLDGLQSAKIIKNDGWKEIIGITHRFATDNNTPRIVVELQEVD